MIFDHDFTVNPQTHIVHDSSHVNGTTGFFVLDDSPAATRLGKRKKRTIPSLPVPTQWYQPSHSTSNTGLMTPQTPSNTYHDCDVNGYPGPPGLSNLVFPTPYVLESPRDSSAFVNSTYSGTSEFGPSSTSVCTTALPPATQEDAFEHQEHRQFSEFTSDLLLSPFVPMRTPHRAPATIQNALPADHNDPEHSFHDCALPSMLPSPDWPDHMDGHAIRPELSPLIIEGCQLSLPAFDDHSRSALADIGTTHSRNNIPRHREARKSKLAAIAEAQRVLSKAKLNATSFLLNILEAKQTDDLYYLAHEAFFRQSNEDNIRRLLTLIFEDEKGGPIFKEWMKPHATDLVCEIVHREMDSAKPFLAMNSNLATPEFIETWDIDGIMDPIGKNVTPTWSTVLDAATETKTAKSKATETLKDSRNRPTTRNVISAQVYYLRSQHSCKVQIGLGLMASSSGASRNLIGVLHQAGLSTSFSSIANTITSLANHSVEEAVKVSDGPHGGGYDNVNCSSSIYVEQRPGTMNKVQSGTFPVIYKLVNAQPEDVRLAPMMERLKNSKPLDITDLRPSREALSSYRSHTLINISKILFKHVSGFEELALEPTFQHKTRRALPEHHKTVFYPLRASTIEEASVEGNLLVHDDIYVNQLRKDPKTLGENAVPYLNDQLTNARIRGAQALRAKDVNPWEKRETFQLAFGMFHLILNLIWALLKIHRGTMEQHGSLSHYFAVLDKARLGAERPDFHTLLAALTQILEGLILNAWRSECDQPTLEAFSKSQPKPDKILDIAQRIVRKYARPTDKLSRSDTGKKDGNKKDSDLSSGADSVHDNTVLLTRDLLYVIELVDAVSAGDFGQVEDILPDIACIFRGAGSNNYSTEILHLLFNMKEVWTPEFANIMRDIMLVNPSGLQGHAMGIDLNIEHLIGYLKALFIAKGIYANWDRLGSISAAINYLQLIKKRSTKSMGAGYQGSTHKTPDTSALVWRIANKARELKLQQLSPQRIGKAKPVIDLRKVGFNKFETSSLATFNKKIKDMIDGHGFDSDEVDEIPLADFEPETVDFDGNTLDIDD